MSEQDFSETSDFLSESGLSDLASLKECKTL